MVLGLVADYLWNRKKMSWGVDRVLVAFHLFRGVLYAKLFGA